MEGEEILKGPEDVPLSRVTLFCRIEGREITYLAARDVHRTATQAGGDDAERCCHCTTVRGHCCLYTPHNTQ